MNIILGTENIPVLQEKYIVLELDTFVFPGADTPVTAWALIENLSMQDIAEMDQYRDLHKNLIKNYRLKNWRYCEDALEHLKGRWHNDLDSFYENLEQRVSVYKNSDPGPQWTHVVDRTKQQV